MAKIEFSSENKVKSDFDFPKLYLDHGERARIVCIETAPEVEFVHTLNAPQIINGEVVMEKVKQKDGSITEKPKMDFVGRHICFGNPNTMAEKGKDPANCPTCAAGQQSDAIWGAKRRFAMHVVQYKTQPGSFKIQDPFSAELVVWSFTDKTFNTLTDIMEEHGDLRKKDLLLGPCENKMYQNFDIQVGGTAEWLVVEANTNFVKSLYAQNKLEDLTPAIARKISKEMAQDDIQKVLLKHAQAYGGNTGEGSSASAGEVAGGMDLDGLLSGPSGSQTTPAVPESTEAPAPTPVAEVAPQVEEPKAEEPKKTLDFDSLLDGL